MSLRIVNIVNITKHIIQKKEKRKKVMVAKKYNFCKFIVIPRPPKKWEDGWMNGHR